MIFTYKDTKYSRDYQLFYCLFYTNVIPNWGIELAKKKTVKIRPQLGDEISLICRSDKAPNVFVSKPLTLQVLEDVCIESFTVDKEKTIEGVPVTLSWKVKNATSVILYPNGLNVTGISSLTEYPSHTEQYRLEATNGIVPVSKLLTVAVTPLPKVHYEMPDFSSLLNLPTIDLHLDKLTENINEIAIDRWMESPLSVKPRSALLLWLDRHFSQKKEGLMAIIPGGRTVIVGLRVALLAIALLVLCGSLYTMYTLLLSHSLKSLMVILSLSCIVINIIYICVLSCITPWHSKLSTHIIYYIAAYVLLMMASLPCLAWLLCGGDFSLYKILGPYILLDMNKVTFPIATLVFLTISFWLPTMVIKSYLTKYCKYRRMKANGKL